MKKKDDRPICDCSIYKFPHKIGGKCHGVDFVQFYYYHISSACGSCLSNIENTCQVATGQESINEAECYIDFKHQNDGEHLPIKIEDIL